MFLRSLTLTRSISIEKSPIVNRRALLSDDNSRRRLAEYVSVPWKSAWFFSSDTMYSSVQRSAGPT